MGRRAAPTASTARRPVTRCSRSTRRRPPSAGRCTSATCSATPTPTPSPATSAWPASRSSTRWVGTTTACPPSGASRTTTASAAIRASRTSRASSRRSAATRRRTTGRSPSRAPTSSSCATSCVETDEKIFEALLRRLGLSVDWTLKYATIDERSRRASQRAFLRNVTRGEAYSQEAPTMWDIDFRTAVAQAEMEDRERPGAYHKIAFAVRTAPTATVRSRSTRRGPSCSPPASPSSPTPTTSGTSRCSARRCARRCTASRCPSSPTSSPSPTRAPASP